MCMYNALIGSEAGHPICKKMIDLILWNVKQRHYGHNSLYPTGPGAYMTAAIDHVRAFPHACMIGTHTSDKHIEFESRIIKCKYNDARGADNSDLPGTNDYGKMWCARDVYRTLT